MKNRFIIAKVTLLLSLFTSSLWAQDNSTTMDGTCGDNISWTLSDDGVLTLTGTGAMTNYDTGYNQGPWRYRTDIRKVVVGNGITTIGDYAFFSSSEINSVKLPASVTTIGTGAFEDLKCTEIELPSSLTTIKERAFDGSKLTSIAIPDKVTRIDDWAFSNCNLSSFHVPASVTHLGMYLLADGNPNLETITVDENNTVYDSRNNCNAIIETSTNTLVEGCKTTVIPSTVTAIGDYAFRGRNEMTKLVIPATVTSVGEGVFSTKAETKEFIFEGTTPPTIKTGAFSNFYDGIVRVPNVAVDAYRKVSELSSRGDMFRAMTARTHATYNKTGTAVKIFYDDKASVEYNWYGCEITKDNFIISDEIGQSIHDDGGIKDPNHTIATIEFDESIKDYRRTSCNNMFENLNALESVKGLNYLNTENVTTMIRMFSGCTQLKKLDLSGFNTKNVKSMNLMFQACESLRDIIVSDEFTTEKLSGENNMFVNNFKLPHKDGGMEYANYIDGNFKKKVGTLGDEPFGATGKELTVDNCELTDGCDFQLTETAPVTATSISYNRAMTSTWGTLCLPFDIKPQTSGNNCQYYTIKSIADDAITLNPTTTTIAAGTPVIFKRTDDTGVATINGEGLLHADANVSGNLVGTFTTQIAPQEAYFIAKDAFRLVSDYQTMYNKVKVAAFRAYILPDEGQILSANTLRITTGDATAIDAAKVFDTINNGTAEYYDASGKRTDGLHKGLNIVKTNGKTMKIIMK